VKAGLRAGTFQTRPGLTASDRACRQIAQRLKQSLTESLRRADGGSGQATLGGQPRPERLLPSGVLHINEQVFRAFRLIAEQQHQPRQTSLSGRLELQFRMGQLRTIPHRRAVPEPDQRDVHIRVEHSLPAHL
jgi:hypothetical protein